jgi:hypothetical protein
VSKQQSPRLLFHNFDPAATIFNAHTGWRKAVTSLSAAAR